MQETEGLMREAEAFLEAVKKKGGIAYPLYLSSLLLYYFSTTFFIILVSIFRFFYSFIFLDMGLSGGWSVS